MPERYTYDKARRQGEMDMPAHLLLVEDDKEIARIVQDHLRRQGYKVTWSSTGAEGWETTIPARSI